MNVDHLRTELLNLLNHGSAYDDPREILAEFPEEAINATAPNVTYSPCELLEHIRFCQQEILEMIEEDTMPTYTFPDDFWPGTGVTATPEQWDSTVAEFFADRERLMELARTADLEAPCRNNPNHSILHALMNVAAHNHYHFGEFAVLRQVMGTWPASHQ